MNVRPEFQQFVGSSSWGKQRGMYKPTPEEMQANSFALPVDESMTGPINRMHLDFLNIGSNVEGFNALDEGIKSLAKRVADRRGSFDEIRAQGPQGATAAIHVANVATAHNRLIGSLLGPTGYSVIQAMEALAPHVPNGEGRQLSLQIGTSSGDMVAADVYPLSTVNYMGSKMKGVTEEPLGRVYIDMAEGTAFMLPDDAFQGRS